MINQSAEGRGRRATHHSRGRGRVDNGGRGRGHRQPVSNGEGCGQFNQQWQEPPLGQPAAAPAELGNGPPPGLTSPDKPLQGTVASLLGSYGFIRPSGSQPQVFFHGSEVQNVDRPSDEQFDLRQLLHLGDEVSFEIKRIAQREKKITAINVLKLQKGTIAALQSASKGRYRGSVQSLPGQSSWRSQDVTPGKITYIKPTSSQDEAKEQLALYKPADLRESSVRLRAGDKVEFSLVQQDSLNEELATDVVLLPRVASAEQDGGQLKGCVISLKEGFGFIRPATRPNERIYFRLADCVGGPSQQPALNAEVAYVMMPDPRGHQDRAANVQPLSSEAARDQLSMLPGSRQGRVIKPPTAAAAEEKMDGVLVYNEGQAAFNCSFGAFQLPDGSSVEEDDEVHFEGGINMATGARKATSVQLASKANEQSVRRELGQIITMRTQFGFIKCCERPGEMFFHFSVLEGGPEAFAVGMDVEFSVTREPKGERLNAVEIAKAPQGSAVFETVSEEEYTGRVVDRMTPPRGYNAVSVSGLVAFEVEGHKEQLPFGFGDLQDSSLNPGSGDKVTFQMATHIATAKAAEKAGGCNSRYAGKRAVHVAPVVQEGLTVSLNGSSGLIEFTQDQPYVMEKRDDKQRIPFQTSEVQDEQELKPSDIVQFVLQTDARSKERQAARVARIKTRQQSRSHKRFPEGDGVVPEEGQRKNPNAMKFIGGSAEGLAKARANQAVRIARGPDGTKGFTAALQPGGRAKLLPPPSPTPPQAADAPGADSAATRATPGSAAPHMNHMPRSDASPPAPQSGAGQQTQLPAQGKVKGQNPRVGRGRGQGTTNSPGPTTPMQISQILQPPSRQQSSSPVPRGASPSPVPIPVMSASSRKQKPSSANQGLHRQTVMSQTARQQTASAQQNAEMPQPVSAPTPDGKVVSAADGQTPGDKASGEKASKDTVVATDGSAPERTSSGRMLNPFASTFIPRTSSGSMLSTSSSQ